jgi:hypothetical protein
MPDAHKLVYETISQYLRQGLKQFIGRPNTPTLQEKMVVVTRQLMEDLLITGEAFVEFPGAIQIKRGRVVLPKPEVRRIDPTTMTISVNGTEIDMTERKS